MKPRKPTRRRYPMTRNCKSKLWTQFPSFESDDAFGNLPFLSKIQTALGAMESTRKVTEALEVEFAVDAKSGWFWLIRVAFRQTVFLLLSWGGGPKIVPKYLINYFIVSQIWMLLEKQFTAAEKYWKPCVMESKDKLICIRGKWGVFKGWRE